MQIDTDTEQLFARLNATRLSAAPQYCGSDLNPGVDEVPEWQIWINRPTTFDQQMIENHLDQVVNRTSSILHIGVGNSSLAKRFSSRVDHICGTTLHVEEKLFADDLNIPNYEVTVTNKFSSEMTTIVAPFDFLVDNNPSSFTCCLMHFCRMLSHYAASLGDGGAILTAQPGLGWVRTNNHPAWSLDWNDWQSLGEALGLRPEEFPNQVFALRRVKQL